MATVTITISINGRDVTLTKDEAVRICDELSEALGVSRPAMPQVAPSSSPPLNTPPWYEPISIQGQWPPDRKEWDLSVTPDRTYPRECDHP